MSRHSKAHAVSRESRALVVIPGQFRQQCGIGYVDQIVCCIEGAVEEGAIDEQSHLAGKLHLIDNAVDCALCGVLDTEYFLLRSTGSKVLSS